MKDKITRIFGHIQHSDLEGGYYTLKTKQGNVYKLEGGDSGLYQAGQEVEVSGVLEENSFGIGFGMPIFQVQTYNVSTK